MKQQGKRPVSQLDPNFGEWLRRTRANKGYTLAALGKRVGMSASTLAQFEHGQKNDQAVSIEVFVRLAEALDMELGYLLHKAGFDIGAGGIKLNRLRRVEEVAEAFAGAEVTVRAAVAEAMAALRAPDGLNVEEADSLINGLGRALGMLDLVTERLREQGFDASAFRRVAFVPDQRRPWTPEEDEWLRAHSDLDAREAARQLSRSLDAIRARRANLYAKETG